MVTGTDYSLARIADEAGLDYVEDLCTAVVHRYELREPPAV